MNRTRFASALAMAALAAIILPQFLHAQITFERTYGGAGWDVGRSVLPTTDGGYALVGYTDPRGAGDDSVWFIKTDAHGDTMWTRKYGGVGTADGWSLQQTTDRGYVIAGFTEPQGSEYHDVLIIKTDQNGDTSWVRTFGGGSCDHGYSVQQTSDSGYIVAGWTQSYGAGSGDVYLVKTAADGDSIWTRTYGGASDDGGCSVQQTSDGGYIVSGYTQSFGDGWSNVWLIKTDVNGDTIWTRTYGDDRSGDGNFVQQTDDGGYVIACVIQAPGPGPYVAGLIKTDANGDTTWTRTFGTGSWNACSCVQQTADGGYILTGTTEYFSISYNDVYLIRTNGGGDSLWTRCYGDSGDDEGEWVRQTADGGFMITGYTRHTNNEFPDFYLIKTDSLGNVAVAEPKASPTRVQALSLTCEPNPFRTRTAISFQPTANSPTELTVFDVSGRCVRTLTVDRASCAVWDGTDELGQPLPSGTYFGQVNAGNEHATARVVLQR